MKFLPLFLTLASGVIAQDAISASGTSCEPHGDHWHCPSGVPEPTTPPPAEAATAPAAMTPAASASTTHSHDEDYHDHDHSASAGTTCSAHGDHWHCPYGVAEPTTSPSVVAATTTSTTTGVSSFNAIQSTNAAEFTGGVAAFNTRGGGVASAIKGGVITALMGFLASI